MVAMQTNENLSVILLSKIILQMLLCVVTQNLIIVFKKFWILLIKQWISFGKDYFWIYGFFLLNMETYVEGTYSFIKTEIL